MSWKARFTNIVELPNSLTDIKFEVEYYNTDSEEKFREIFQRNIDDDLDIFKQLVLDKVEKIQEFKDKVKDLKDKERDKDIKREKPQKEILLNLKASQPIPK